MRTVEDLPAYDEPGTEEEEAVFEERATRIVDEGVSDGERRALHRKMWRLQGRSGGEVRLAERMLERGLMTPSEPGARRELVRTRIGQYVLQRLRPS